MAAVCLPAMILAGAGAATPTQVSANTGDRSAIAFSLNCSLNAGLTGTGYGDCTGTWNGVVNGSAPTSGVITAAIYYQFNQCPEITGDVIGTASVYTSTGVLLTTEYFLWAKTGPSVVIEIADTPYDPATRWPVDGAGTAAFIPTPTTPVTAFVPPSCTPKLDPQPVLVAGTAAWT